MSKQRTGESAAEETSAVRSGHQFDETKLASYLSAKIEGFGPSVRVRQFKGGQSNPTFLLESNGARYVLRKKPPGALLPSAHMVEREHEIMSALAGTAVPVPAMRVLCEDPTIVGTPFYVMDFLEGRVFRDTRLPGLSNRERGAIYESMADTLAALHAVRWDAVGLSEFGRPSDYVRRQVARWTKQYQASRTDENPAMEKLIAWLPEHVPADDAAAIAHGDFRLENLVFAPDSAKVIGLLDWELATIGHPLSDVAFNCMNYRLPSSMTALGGLSDVDIAGLGIPSEQQYLAMYCKASGRSEIPDWNYFLAFALFRCAAILQGVFARSLQNSSSNESAAEVGRLSRPVSETAWRIVSA